MSVSSSRVALGAVVVAMVALSGCRVSVETKTRFVEENVAPAGNGIAWAGTEKIRVDIQGVGISVNGGVTVTAVPNATTVTANARMLGFAFDKPDADLSIIDAKATFTITKSGDTITVACGHGQTHGSSNSGESGCELVQISIPAGSAQQKLDLTALAGNGELKLELGSATIANVGANNNGSGDTTATLPATVGASIAIVAEKSGDITASMPSGFAADEIILQADASKIVNTLGDVQLNAGVGSRGTAGTGLRSLKLTSKEFAGSTGTITLR